LREINREWADADDDGQYYGEVRVLIPAADKTWGYCLRRVAKGGSDYFTLRDTDDGGVRNDMHWSEWVALAAAILDADMELRLEAEEAKAYD
jgi:hypothetical protein